MPLPVQRDGGTGEPGTCLDGTDCWQCIDRKRPACSDRFSSLKRTYPFCVAVSVGGRAFPTRDGFADAVAVHVNPDDAPAVGCPGHRLKVHDASPGIPVLEMQEPVLAGGVGDPAALVRSACRRCPPGRHVGVRGGLADAPPLIRPEGRVGAQRELPAGLHAACRREYPVAPVVLIEFCSLDSEVAVLVAVEDQHLLPDGACAGRVQFTYVQDALEAHAAAGPCVCKVHAAVIVEQGARIDHSAPRDHADRFGPASARILRADLVNAPVRVSPEDVEASVGLAVADGGGEDGIAVVRAGQRPVPVGTVRRQRRPDYLPFHQICRMQYLQSWYAVEGRRGHPVFPVHALHIRIGIVRIKYRIGKLLDICAPCGTGAEACTS